MELSRNWTIVIVTFLLFVGIGGLQQCSYDQAKALKRLEKGCDK